MRALVFKITALSTLLSFICMLADSRTVFAAWFGVSSLAFAGQVIVKLIIKFINWLSK